MTLSHKGVIRGADIDGVVFCDPSGKLESPVEQKRQEEEQLKALELFWLSKGREEGKKEGFDEGFSEGEKEGLRKGEESGTAAGKEEGDSAGYERGLKEGREEVEENLKKPLDIVLSIAKEVGEEREQAIEGLRHELIQFCIAICQNLLRRELSNTEVFTELVEELIDQAKPIAKEGDIEISVSTDSFEALQAVLPTLKLDEEFKQRVSLIADPAVMTGDCRIEAGMGLVNFSIERHLAEFERKILEVSSDEPLEESLEEPLEETAETAEETDPS